MLPDSVSVLQKLTALRCNTLTTVPPRLDNLTSLASFSWQQRVIPEVIFRCSQSSKFRYEKDRLAANFDALEDLKLTPVTTHKNHLAFRIRSTLSDCTLKRLAANAVCKYALPTAGLPADLIGLVSKSYADVCTVCHATVYSWIEVRLLRSFKVPSLSF